MLENSKAFSGFAASEIGKVKEFYTKTRVEGDRVKLATRFGGRTCFWRSACSLFAEGSRQGHFFGFAFFTADKGKDEG
jgi:hypothetical protein